MSRKKKKAATAAAEDNVSKSAAARNSDNKKKCSSPLVLEVEGETLHSMLNLIHRAIESVKNNSSLPEKLCFKQQFAIGVNEVTRVLERMPPPPTTTSTSNPSPQQQQPLLSSKLNFLQAVIVAGDCNPRWLTKHVQSLACSRGVPLIVVKDQKKASLRLGQILNLKTALALGVKAKGTAVNQIIDDIITTSHSEGEDIISILNTDNKQLPLQHT